MKLFTQMRTNLIACNLAFINETQPLHVYPQKFSQKYEIVIIVSSSSQKLENNTSIPIKKSQQNTAN